MSTPSAVVSPQAPSRGGGGGRLVLLGLLLVALLVGLKLLPVNDWLLRFVAWIRDAGATGMAVFVVAYIVACILLLPGLILTLGAGFAYGIAVGVPLVWVAANLGAAGAFLPRPPPAPEPPAARG